MDLRNSDEETMRIYVLQYVMRHGLRNIIRQEEEKCYPYCPTVEISVKLKIPIKKVREVLQYWSQKGILCTTTTPKGKKITSAFLSY